MKFSNQFQAFVNSGQIPSTDREKSALLDEARSVISSITRRISTGELTVTGPGNAVSPAARQFAMDKVTRPGKPTAAVAKPVATAPVGSISAQAFTASQSKVMLRADFVNMVPKHKMAFVRSGGTLV